MSRIQLRTPLEEECEALTQLCLRSKAHWGYEAAFVAACRDELTITPHILDQRFCLVAEGETILGYLEVGLEADGLHVEKLFVDPIAIGKGIGSLLMKQALKFAERSGAEELVIEADPEAAPFYLRLGAMEAGEVSSGSIPGRMLPRLVFPIQHSPASSR
uniref:GNAT family N-acetyltransferase n=1 Tax=uncultured Altererythrobacter sp. TaxID=500840 RepID=UPI00260185E6|nr:GNAT family N-acetyltransferase [uncultured Altererythrobacter sp.]